MIERTIRRLINSAGFELIRLSANLEPDELRTLAAQKLAQEKPGQTLQPTALVHEAYLRLVDVEQAQLAKGNRRV